MAELKAGTYQVIGDILTLKQGTGDNVTYEKHRRGATVKLTQAQAQMLGGGSRPMVRPAEDEEAAASTQAADSDNEQEKPETTTKGTKSTAKTSS